MTTKQTLLNRAADLASFAGCAEVLRRHLETITDEDIAICEYWTSRSESRKQRLTQEASRLYLATEPTKPTPAAKADADALKAHFGPSHGPSVPTVAVEQPTMRQLLIAELSEAETTLRRTRAKDARAALAGQVSSLKQQLAQPQLDGDPCPMGCGSSITHGMTNGLQCNRSGCGWSEAEEAKYRAFFAQHPERL